MKKITFILAIFIELALLNLVSAENNSGFSIATILLHESAKGFYTNNTISTIANATTIINATTTSNTVIILQVITTSNVTNSSITIIDYSSTPSGITNLTTIGIYGLNKFFDISVGSSLNSSLRWVVINISYNESEVNASGLNESSLRIYYYNSTSGNWSSYDTPFGGVNTTSNYVWANTTHFSYYSLGGLLVNGQSCNSNSNCSSGYCVHSICRPSSPYCGDGYCDTGENCANSVDDCKCPPYQLCNAYVGVCFTPSSEGVGSYTPPCQENWTCTNWSECIDGVQTRTCTNLGGCFDNKGKPNESQSCIVSSTPSNVTPPTPIRTSVPVTTPAASVTQLGLGVGLIAVIALSAIIIFIILKRKKIKKKTKFANMIP
jgi:hypothetical protein